MSKCKIKADGNGLIIIARTIKKGNQNALYLP